MPTDYAGTNTFPAEYEIPSDGDLPDAASLAPSLTALGDRTVYLKDKTDDLDPRVDTLESYARLVKLVSDEDDDWAGEIGTEGWGVPSPSTPSAGYYIDVTGCQVGDKLIIEFSTTAGSLVEVQGSLALWANEDGGSFSQLPGSQTGLVALTTFNWQVSLRAVMTIATAGTVRVQLRGILVDDTNPISLAGIQKTVTVVRP